MSSVDLLRLATLALLRHRLRAALCLLGIAVGVAAVVLLTALGEGARRYVVGQFRTLGADLLIVIPGKTETTGSIPGLVGGVPNDLTLADARVLERSVPEIRLLTPMSIGNDTVAHRERSRKTVVLGATEEMLEIQSLRVQSGSFLPAGDFDRGAPVTVLGSKLARELLPGENALGKIVRVGDWRLRVVGVLAPRGMHLGFDLDEAALVPVATGMRMFNRSSVYQILLKLHPAADPAAARRHVRDVLVDRHDEEDFTCITPDAVAGALTAILGALTAALTGIAAVSLSVAGIVIMNVMLVSVTERTAEVGLLKALGARSRQILALFLAEAVILSGIGGLLGLGASLLAVRALALAFPAFPAAAPGWALGAALAVSVGTGVIFGVIPARRATRLDPVAALTRGTP